MHSVLDTVTAGDVRLDPFPHIVIDNALPDTLAAELSKGYPPEEILKGGGLGSNMRFNFSLDELRANGSLTSAWESFLTTHTSKKFFEQFVSVFRDALVKQHPDRALWWAHPERLRVGVTDVDIFDSSDVLMSAYLAGNTPVTEKASSIKIAHVDNTYKLFTGLLYLRSPEDDSTGGELELYRYKRDTVKFYGQRFIDRKHVEFVQTIPYTCNRLVLFPNSLRAVHAVSVRNPTPHVRKFVNLSCDVREPFMDIAPYWENTFDKIERRLRSALRREDAGAFIGMDQGMR